MVLEGVLLAAAMTHQKVLPNMALSMLAMGEETGEIDQMINNVADFYEDKVATIAKFLISILEPAIFIVARSMVGELLQATYLPMFKAFDEIL